MRKIIVLSIFLLFYSLTGINASDIPDFLFSATGEIEVIIKVKDNNADLARINMFQSQDLPLTEKRAGMERLIKTKSTNSQSGLMSVIQNRRSDIVEYKSFWITNAVYVKADADFIRELVSYDEVEGVFENIDLVLVEPVASTEAEDVVAGAEQGLEVIGVRDAWKMGLNGNGRLVCNFDTGVDGDHPALLNSWRGANGGSVAESWFDPYTGTDFPEDARGHGTHTMGTMVGHTGGDTIGVAIGAQWIAAGVVDRGGSIERTIADIISAFEWAADPDRNPSTSDDVPDVVNNSWGVPSGMYGPCDDTFWDAIDNLEALGVVCLFAAGNEGPTPSSLRTPADRITTQFNSFAVGAVDGTTMNVANFSSRGPSGCDGVTIKPELTAPGVIIRSSVNGGGYGYKSGTSMATPHVAGAVAILRQFNPNATVDQIKRALIEGAVDLGAEGEDNNYGHGALNIMNSIYRMTPPSNPFMQVLTSNISDNHNGVAEPGESFGLQIRLVNLGIVGNVEASLEAASSGVEILSNYANLGRISHLDTLTSTVFSMKVNDSYSIGENIDLKITFYSGDWSQEYNLTLNHSGTSENSIATINTNTLALTFSNYGQFGLGENSLFPSGGTGFRYPANGLDFMKEASLMIGSSGRVSDGARDTNNESDNDFRPIAGGLAQVTYPGIYADYDGYAAYSDSAAEIPIGVEIIQRCFAWDMNTKFVIAEFTIKNTTYDVISDLLVGMYCDWDLAMSSGIDDIVNYDDSRSLGYIEDLPSGWCIGVKAITDYASSYRAIDCDEEINDGFSNSEKLEFMNSGFDIIHYNSPGDYAQLLTLGPYSLLPGESEVVAFAFVVGESLNEIRTQADLAFTMYPQLTDIQEEGISLPSAIKLNQNYPNPFNNTTLIGLETNSPAELVIYDILGKVVKQFSIESPGYNEVIWDGRNANGEDVVSGVYFYNIASEGKNNSKKMILLK